MRLIWEATDRVAAELCAIPTVQAHAEVLGTWRTIDPPDHVRQVLHNDPMSSIWERHPLLMGLPYSEYPGAERMASEPDGEAWLRGAMLVALGFGRIVEWLRSRLSGYPQLVVPHLIPTCARRQESGFFFGPGFPWWKTFQGEAPHLQNRVNVETLEVDSGRGQDLQEAVANVADSLSSSAAMCDFVAARSALTDDAIAELKAVRKAFRDQSRDELVDAVEPQNLMRRHSLLEVILAEVLDEAAEMTRQYMDAFVRVDELLSTVARVIEELVVFGPPASAGAVAEGTWHPGPSSYRVRLSTTGDRAFVGGLRMVEVTAEVDDLAGAVLTDTQSVSFGRQDDDVLAAVTGDLLPESAGTLRSGPARVQSRRRQT